MLEKQGHKGRFVCYEDTNYALLPLLSNRTAEAARILSKMATKAIQTNKITFARSAIVNLLAIII